MSKDNEKDFRLISQLYTSIDKKPKKKIHILFILIIIFFVGLIYWATTAAINKTTKVEETIYSMAYKIQFNV